MVGGRYEAPPLERLLLRVGGVNRALSTLSPSSTPLHSTPSSSSGISAHPHPHPIPLLSPLLLIFSLTSTRQGFSKSNLPEAAASHPFVTMPTPRRVERASASSTPSRQRGPSTPQPHHHRTADELALEEASEIVHEVEAEEATPAALLSPRARRYAAITRKREASVDPTPSLLQALSPRAAPEGAEASEDAELGDGVTGSDSGEEGSFPSSVGYSSHSDASSDDSDSDSDSDASSNNDSDDSEEEADLERHFAAAKAAAAKTTTMSRSKSSNESSNALGENEDGELRLESDQPKET